MSDRVPKDGWSNADPKEAEGGFIAIMDQLVRTMLLAIVVLGIIMLMAIAVTAISGCSFATKADITALRKDIQQSAGGDINDTFSLRVMALTVSALLVGPYIVGKIVWIVSTWLGRKCLPTRKRNPKGQSCGLPMDG